MIGLKVIETVKPPGWASLVKQLEFGTAVGLTKTAKDAQAGVVSALQGTFTLRGNWWTQSNKFGIKITPATKNTLFSEVKTAADWLELHETGGEKTPKGSNIAIPTDNVRRNKRMIIPKAQRPRGLMGKNTFIQKTKKGDTILFQRQGRGKNQKVVALYILEPSVRIRKQSTFYEPIKKIVASNLDRNVRAGIQRAFATAK